jgi:hypothetical protein
MFSVCKLPLVGHDLASGLLIGRSCLVAGHDGPRILCKQLFCPLQLYFAGDLRRLASAGGLVHALLDAGRAATHTALGQGFRSSLSNGYEHWVIGARRTWVDDGGQFHAARRSRYSALVTLFIAPAKRGY